MKLIFAIAFIGGGAWLAHALGGPAIIGALAGTFAVIFLYSASLGKINREYRTGRSSSDCDFDSSDSGGGD